jgi:hypothetical protein
MNMKKSKRMTVSNYFVGFLMLALTCVICGCTQEENRLNTEKRLVDRSSVELYAGQGAGDLSRVKIRSIPEGAQYTWTSLDSKVATVDQTGLVTAVSEGYAVITAASDNELANVVVVVKKWIPLVQFQLEGFDMNENEIVPVLVKSKNDKFQLVAVGIVPEDATEPVKWTSNDTDVAVVLEDGWITCMGEGSAMLTATIASGFKLTVQIDVEEATLGTIEIPDGKPARAARVPDAKMSFPGYDNDSQMETIGYSSQATNEGASPNGRVTAMLADNNQFWHARWSSPSADYPHWFIVDLEEEVEICGVLLARRDGNNGTAEGYRLFTCPDDPSVDQTDPEDGYGWVNQGDFSFDRNNNSEQIQWLEPPFPTARYVKMYFGPEHKGGSGQYAMFRRFGLYMRAED